MSSDLLSSDSDLCHPNHLYHILLTTITPNPSPNAPPLTRTAILATYTDRSSAQQAARETLYTSGYSKRDFSTLEIREQNTPLSDWQYGDDVYAYAVARNGETFTVAVEATENALGLARCGCRRSEEELWYVQRAGEDGGARIRGVYRTLRAARAAGRKWMVKSGVAKGGFVSEDVCKGEDEEVHPEGIVCRAVDHGGKSCVMSVVKQVG